MSDKEIVPIKESNITVTDKKGIGRPSVITSEKVQILIACLQRGLDVDTSCDEAQIGRSTYYEHMKGDPLFADKMIRARNRVKVLAGNRVVEILEKGSDKEAGAMARFVFERKMKEEWGSAPGIIINANTAYKPPSWFHSGEVKEGEVVK